MDRPRILLQLDTDSQASSFDAIVAIDAGVDQLLQYAHVTPENVTQLVHGAIFTRGGEDLSRTAIMIGGSNVSAGEAILEGVRAAFFGPLRVSAMLDSNGANTTACAAILSASRHLTVADITALVLAGTGPVGQRIAHLLIAAGGRVRLASRDRNRAATVCGLISSRLEAGNRLEPVLVAAPDDLAQALAGASVIFSAGAAVPGVTSLSELAGVANIDVAIDLNAVPPAGIEGIQPGDRGEERCGIRCYGAIGVGVTKMKLHREAIRRLFTAQDLIFDADTLFPLGMELELPS